MGYRYNNLDYTLDEWTSYVLTDIQREESAANVPLPEPGDDEMEEQQPTINDLETQRVQDSQGSLPDLPSLSQMEDIDPEPAAPQLARASGPMGGQKGSKETPITPATPSYGLPETHTTILPFRAYFGATVGNTYDGTSLRIRLNSIYDIIVDNINNITAASSITATTGLFNKHVQMCEAVYPQSQTTGTITGSIGSNTSTTATLVS